MTERRRDLLVILLFLVLVVGSCAASLTIGLEEPLSAFLPLLWLTALMAYKLAFWLSGRTGAAAAAPRVEFGDPVYVLQNTGGLVLCTDEPDGGYLAVFTGPDTAARFREIRGAHDWAPAPFSRTQLRDLLHSARHTGRVAYVMIDPLGDGRTTAVFPLSHRIGPLTG
jgi:hypothetical protein